MRMRRIRTGLAVVASLLPMLTHAAGKDDPVLAKVMIDQLELRVTDGPNPGFLDAQAWIGKDLHKLWLKTEAEYEVLFTQRLILTPELELNLHSKDDKPVGVGAGLSDLELGLRLRYEIRREFAPYIGVNWVRAFGDTADFARDEGEDAGDVQFVAGVRAWF